MSIAKDISNAKQSRLYLLSMVRNLSVKQLNHIPDHFRNNIVWNMGHLIWAQQDCYVKAELNPPLDTNYFELYTTGTVPQKPLTEKEIDALKRHLIEPLETMEVDLNDGSQLAKKYIKGLAYHDWLHNGYILAMKRLL